MTDTADPREAAVAAMHEALRAAIEGPGLRFSPEAILDYLDANPAAKQALREWLNTEPDDD